MDFDEEGIKLIQALNLAEDPNKSKYNDLDPIYKDPEKEAFVYVGNRVIAQDYNRLDHMGIRYILNCTDSIPMFQEDRLYCMRFHISSWKTKIRGTPDKPKLDSFFKKPFAFIEKALKEGHSVLIHCLAGAHRAGTCGVVFILYKNPTFTFDQVLEMLRKCRPIINPIGLLIELAKTYDKTLKLSDK